MKHLLTTTLTTITLGLFAVAPVSIASTPDGITPAEETVCDPLKADGITKGLYGLCIAFCEAQDLASVDTPITEEELEVLVANAPSMNILNNYNKKKDKANNPNDLEMPCIVITEPVDPCPCFTKYEASQIGAAGVTQCFLRDRDQPGALYISATGMVANSNSFFCRYRDSNLGINRIVFPISTEQNASCNNIIAEVIEEYSVDICEDAGS